jgi:hypothetical protein
MKNYFHLEKVDLWAILLLGLAFYFTPRPKPSFNPFDNQFNVLFEDVVKEKCDKVNIGCGEFALTKNINNKTVFYRFFQLDYSYAKGLLLNIDTIKYDKNSMENEAYKKQVIFDVPIDFGFIAKEMAFFKVKLAKIERKKEYNSWEISFKTNDNKIIEGYIDIEELEEENYLVRKLIIQRRNNIQAKTIREHWQEFLDSFQKQPSIAG